jgi:GTP-binding protein
MRPSGVGKTRIVFHAPSRGADRLPGRVPDRHARHGRLNRLFHHYEPHKGEIEAAARRADLQRRRRVGRLRAVEPRRPRPDVHRSGEKVYQGMIIGENSRDNDLDVNALKGKQLTNVRASGKDEAVRLTPPRRLTLEQAIAYIETTNWSR